MYKALGELVGRVRVDQQGVGQFAGRAGELRKDQHPLSVVARGDELLGHQVHAVVQRADHAAGRDAVQPEHLLGAVMLVDENDRPPGSLPVTPVDLVGQRPPIPR